MGWPYQIHVCALLAALWAWGVGITATSAAVATAAGYGLAVILIWRTRPPGLHRHIAWAGAGPWHSLELAGLLALIGVPRLLPLAVQQVPGGWDPSFHSLLASTTLTSHWLPTWAPYFKRREVAYTPVPVSEITAGYVEEKRSLTDELLGLLRAPGTRVVATAGVGSALRGLAGRPVTMLTNQVLGSDGMPAAYVAGPERVYLLGDAFTRMGMAPPGAGAARVLWWQSPGQAPPAGWTAAGTSAGAGWGASAPVAKQGGAAYVRLELAGPLPAGAMLACAAEGGATVYVDGARLAGGCGSGWAAAPALAAAGPHVVAVWASFGAGVEPWLHVSLAAGVLS